MKHAAITRFKQGMIKFPAGVILSLILLVPAFAITLDDALKLALEESEAVRITEHTSEALKAEARKEVAFVKPQANLKADYLRLESDVRTFPGFETPEWLKNGSIEASQVIWAGGRIWRSLQLKKNTDHLSKMEEISGRRQIGKEVKIAFYRVLFQKAVVDILKDRVTQRREELRDAEDLRAAGMVTSLDVRQATLSLNNAVSELKTGEESYNKSLVDFNVAIGRSGKGESAVPEGKLHRAVDMKTRLDMLEKGFGRDALLDIEIAGNNLRSSRLRYEIAGGGYFPEVNIVGSASSTNETTGEMNEIYAAGIQIKWNVMDGGLVRADKAAAGAAMRIAEERARQVKKQIAALVEKLKISAGSIAERIELRRNSVSLAKENYEDAGGHYRAGTITLTRLGEFNLAYAEARFDLARLFFEELLLLVQVEALLGPPLTR